MTDFYCQRKLLIGFRQVFCIYLSILELVWPFFLPLFFSCARFPLFRWHSEQFRLRTLIDLDMDPDLDIRFLKERKTIAET